MSMKSRSLKLREAHKVAASFCCILWDHKAGHFFTSSSSDPLIRIHDGVSLSTRDHLGDLVGVTALALSHDSSLLAAGSMDGRVKLFKLPSRKFETFIQISDLPIRVLAFNVSANLLAAAGDGTEINIYNYNTSNVRVLKGHESPVTGLDFDPNGTLLASLDSTGTVKCWEFQNSAVQPTTFTVPAPCTALSTSTMLRWSPDGQNLAVSGSTHGVFVYDSLNLEERFVLRGDHVGPIAWAPNGKYIATSGLDNQVLLWDLDKKQGILRLKFDERISCMAWKPNSNALSVIDVRGKYGIWEPVVPSSLLSPIPSQSLDDAQVDSDDGYAHTKRSRVSLDDGIWEPVDLSSIFDDAQVDSDDGYAHTKRSRVSLDDGIWEPVDLSSIFDDAQVDSDDGYAHTKRSRVSLDDGIWEPVDLSSMLSPIASQSLDDAQVDSDDGYASTKYKMQSPFQPGATPLEPRKKTFLCYNMLGFITRVEHEGRYHIEAGFHDTRRGPTVMAMDGIYDFTMASINENGCVFASSFNEEKHINSVLCYLPSRSWASNSEVRALSLTQHSSELTWTMSFKGEEVKVVANGSGWVAAVTSLNLLHIFGECGVQKDIISLGGPVVTAAGCKDQLALVTHVSDCLPLNEQVMEFRVFNILRTTQQLKGTVSLTPGSHLTWIGFSEEGCLSSFDSEGVLRVFTSKYGGSWIPVFRKEENHEENYWIVGLNSTQMHCIACKHPEVFPQVTPTPVRTSLDLFLPLPTSELGGAASVENELMLKQLHNEIQRTLDDMASAGDDSTALEKKAFDLEVSQDKCILSLISLCCRSDKFERATEFMSLLSLESSMRAAITLVTDLELQDLAEKFCSIMKEKTEAAKLSETEVAYYPCSESKSFRSS